MTIDKGEARRLLQNKGLRITAPRLAVLRVLFDAQRPLAHKEVLDRMGDSDWDPATIYRNLVKFREVGLAVVASRADGLDRYEMAGRHGADHMHPHFVCDDCGQVKCLPIEIAPTLPVDGRWADSIARAALQLRGECPDCLDREE